MDMDWREQVEILAHRIQREAGRARGFATEILDKLPVPCQIAHKDEAMCRHESCVRAYREEES